LLKIVDLHHRYNFKEVLKGINVEIKRGEVFVLIGPTGAGKTTLLRIIDQLEYPTSGRVYFDGKEILTSPGLRLKIRRRMAMVFQKPVVFNATVFDNVAYPLKVRGYRRKDILRKVGKMLEMVELKGYEKRNARKLSGGEIQRIALAQAVISDPQVLLLDEPTANLDPLSIDLIEKLILDFNKKQGATIVMATHDMSQGERLADRMGVLMEGKLIQVGSPREIFYNPKNVQVAQFTTRNNILKGVVSQNENGITYVDVEGKIIEGVSSFQAGERVYVCIKPEDITLSLSKSRTSARNLFPARINLMSFSGPLVEVELRCPFPLLALITRRSAEEMQLRVGQKVYASFKATAVHIIG